MWRSYSHVLYIVYYCVYPYCSALFRQDHGFNSPYGSKHLPVFNSLYTYTVYTETSTLQGILDTARTITCRSTQHAANQHHLLKLVWVTKYRPYWDFDISHFDTRNSFAFQGGRMRFFLNNAYKLFHPLLFSTIYPACCLSVFSSDHPY